MKKKVILEQIRLDIFRSHSPDVSRFRTTQIIFLRGRSVRSLFTTLLHDHSIHIIFVVIVYHIVENAIRVHIGEDSIISFLLP